MAGFEAKIHKIEVIDHPNADRLALAKIGGYFCVIGKDSFKTGDLAAYIPEGTILPDWLIEKMGLVGKLSGKEKNRVKAIKLRGVLSQGLVLQTENGQIQGQNVSEGNDVTELLELVKYEPPIPTHMSGKVKSGHAYCLNYDIEDIKRYPDVFKPGEPVVLTEKLHGTWCCLGIHPDVGPVVSSKGMSAKGLMFDVDDLENEHNVYVNAWKEHEKTIAQLCEELTKPDEGFYVIGELVGRGVQDLHYGLPNPALRVFDIRIGDRKSGRWFSPQEIKETLSGRLECVPQIFEGTYDEELIKKFTEGESNMSKAGHLREGIVIRPTTERVDMNLGRVILKSVSEKYLTRKGGTDYN